MSLSDIDRDLLQRCLCNGARAWEDFVDRFLGLVIHVINHTSESRSVRLSDQDVICNMNLLPGEPAKNALNPRGIRLGVQEMTRYGMGPEEMAEMGELIHAAIVGARDVRPEVKVLRDRFPDVKYGFAVADLEG